MLPFINSSTEASSSQVTLDNNHSKEIATKFTATSMNGLHQSIQDEETIDVSSEMPISSSHSPKIDMGKLPVKNLEMDTIVLSSSNLNAEMERDTQVEQEEIVEDDHDSGTEAEDEEDYERRRQKRIRENQLLLSSLGINTIGANSLSSTLVPSTTNVSPSRKNGMGKAQSRQRRVFDRSGYILSLPRPGEVHRMACVEIPSDRKLKRRIQEGEYEDRTFWAEGEARRWRFGNGTAGVLEENEEKVIGGVGEDFRWREWRGLENELRAEMKRRGELVEMDSNPQSRVGESTQSSYSMIPGEACHQCRRKSEKRKMKCRNVNPMCRAVFCETCCQRYSYFDFDPESRSFICPLCKDCCNCSNCIRKRNLTHILGPENGRMGIRTSEIRRKANEEGLADGALTVEKWIENAIKNQVAPFDRVRLVDEAEDVISPELPPDPVPEKVPTTGKKRGRPPGPAGAVKKKPKKKKESSEVATEKIVLKFRLPEPEPEVVEDRTKEVDSDGDTVGGFSSDGGGRDHHDEYGRGGESSKSASLSLSPVPPRLAFPPRPLRDMGLKEYPTLAAAAASEPLNPSPPLPQWPSNGYLYYPQLPPSLPLPPISTTTPETVTPPTDILPLRQYGSVSSNPNPISNLSSSVLSNTNTHTHQSQIIPHTSSRNSPSVMTSQHSMTLAYGSTTFTSLDQLPTSWSATQSYNTSLSNTPTANFQPQLPNPLPTIPNVRYADSQPTGYSMYNSYPQMIHSYPSTPGDQHFSPISTQSPLPTIPTPLYHHSPLTTTPPTLISSPLAPSQHIYPYSPVANQNLTLAPLNPTIPPPWHQNLDLLSMAAAEARHSPSYLGYEGDDLGNRNPHQSLNHFQ